MNAAELRLTLERIGWTTGDLARALHRHHAAVRARLRAEAVPQEALEAYRRHGGSAERASEQEDGAAYALIVRWAPAIQEQGLGALG